MMLKYGFSGNSVMNDSGFEIFNNVSKLAAQIFEYSGDQDCADIIEALREISNNPPAFDLGQYWVYPELAAAIAGAKHKDSIWSYLGATTVEKLSLIMELFLYLGAYATQRNNNYHTGFAWRGNFSKKWNPNVQLSVYPLMVYCIDFFGSIEKANELLVNFSFDEVMDRVKANRFMRCYNCWTSKPCQISDGLYAPTAKELLENGGVAYVRDIQGNLMFAGSGETIKQSYMHRKGGLWYLPKDMISACFAGGICSSKIDVDGDSTFDGYILDSSTSPAEGLDGMYTEFNTAAGTRAALRSSLHYCLVDFILVNTLIAYCDKIGWFKLDWDENLRNRVVAGNADLIYKSEHGYHGMNLAQKEILTSEIVNARYPGFIAWKNYWVNVLSY